MSGETKVLVVPTTKVAAPRARVRLRRVTSNLSKSYPPDGQEKFWWERLKKALGTTSSDFVNATLAQIQNASRLPSGGISETSVSAVLAFIEGAEPKNEVEAALAIQMACTHAVTMAVLTARPGRMPGCLPRRNGAAPRGDVLGRQPHHPLRLTVTRSPKDGSPMSIELAHVPTYIKKAASRLHRYCHSG